MDNSQTSIVLSQLVIARVLNNVSIPHEEFIIERMLYVPIAENKCVGVKEVDVLLAPLAESPKFHVTLVIVLSFIIENGILF